MGSKQSALSKNKEKARGNPLLLSIWNELEEK